MTRRNHGRRADANRHDTYITPPCAALAVGQLISKMPDREDVLDPFGGFGSLLAWAGVPRYSRRIIELDDRAARRQEAELYIPPERIVIGDAFAHPWRAEIVITNPPFSELERVARRLAEETKRGHIGVAWMLGPIQPWHSKHFEDVPAPREIAALTWRPDFAAGYGYQGTDASSPSQSYAWMRFGPGPGTSWFRVPRPEIPRELWREHQRLARLAADWPAVSPAPLLDAERESFWPGSGVEGGFKGSRDR